MPGEPIGYSHSILPSGNLRTVAEKFDQKAEGGNENGLIDGKEIKLFKDYVLEHYSYNLDLNNLKQSELITVKNTDRRDNQWDFKTAASKLAETYADNGMNSKIAKFLNKDSDLKSNEAKIAYLSKEDYNNSRAYAEQAELDVKAKIDAEKNPQKKEEVQPRDNLDRGIFKLIDWFFGK